MTEERLKKIGIVFAVLLLSGVFTAVFWSLRGKGKDPRYQGEIGPKDYKITELKKLSEKDEKNDKDIYFAKIVYMAEGFGYTKKVKLFMKPKKGSELYTSFMEKGEAEQRLGSLYYKTGNPSEIGSADHAEVREMNNE